MNCKKKESLKWVLDLGIRYYQDIRNGYQICKKTRVGQAYKTKN